MRPLGSGPHRTLPRRLARPGPGRGEYPRLTAAGPPAEVAARLAAGCGRDRIDLARAVRAWEHGGATALTVLEALARARAQLATTWEEGERAPRLRATGNRWTAVGTDAQVRYGRDGRWWPYRKDRGQWWPGRPAGHDPAAVLAVLASC